MDEVFDISKFNSYREDNCLELKKASENLPDALWETYSAFANTNGGCIILGAKEWEDGSWYATGIKDAAKIKKTFFDTLHNQNKVSTALVSDKDVSEYKVNENIILAIRVPKASREDKPVFVGGDMWKGTYRRDWEGDYHCSKATIMAMLRDQTEKTADMKILEKKEISDFNQDSVRSYRQRYNASHEGHPWTELPDDQFLMQIGAASDETEDGRIHPTSAGLLMFGTYQRIMREFPNFLLDYYEKMDSSLRWTDRLASHNGDWSGNIYDFYVKVYAKIAVDLKKPFRLEGIYRVDDTPIHVAVREVLANCLSNADFFLPGCVKIEKYPDKLIFSNPGSINLGKKQMLRGGKSEPRNRIILNMFNFIGIGERAGSGVPNVYSIWERENLEEPVVEEASGREGTICTTVTLPLMNRNADSPLLGKDSNFFEKGSKKGSKKAEIERRVEEVYEAIKSNPNIKSKELENMLNATKKQIQDALKKLQDSNRIQRENGNRKGKWNVF